MGISVRWSWIARLSSLLFMGGVWCDCTERDVGMEGGLYRLTGQLQPGSLLTYRCPEGYYPYPDLSRTCQKNGAWKPAPKRSVLQRCRLVECPDPKVLEFGNVSPPQERYFVNNQTAYECVSGFRLRGSSRRVCLPNGKWSGSTPICSRDTGNCADPGIPAGAVRTGNLVSETGAVVKYNCSNNLMLVGSRERRCLPSGQWSGIEPACYFKYTYDSPLEVSQIFGSAIKHHLTDLEPVGHTQVGRRITVSKTGKLNIYMAVDISPSMDTESISSAIDIILKLIVKISSFVVTPNYEIILFARDVFEVVDIMDFRSGTVTLQTVVERLRSFTINDRETFIKDTDLNFAFKTFLERIISIKQQVGEEAFKEERHVLIFFTDGAYNMGEPAPTVQKIKNLVYTSGQTPGETPSTHENLDIYIFATGANPFDDDLYPLTTGTNSKHYFRLKNMDDISELFDYIIDDEQVKGLCGLHEEYSTTDPMKNKMYPWMAFLFINNGVNKTRCLGSLVSPQFVLTAAHCLTSGNLPEHIIVEINDGAGKSKKVKRVIIHPSFNINAKAAAGVRENYDYDVALIQLETGVHISRAARPICIPCTQETSDALQLVGNSTCVQQEEILLKNHLERLTFLTRSFNQKDVYAKLGDNRDECISHALQAEGITTTNPRDVVSDNFLCTGGQNPFPEPQACAGDGGSAVFKNYKHRTIQVALFSWGNKRLCPRSRLIKPDENARDFHINLFRVVPFLKSVLGNNTQDEYEPLRFLDG